MLATNMEAPSRGNINRLDPDLVSTRAQATQVAFKQRVVQRVAKLWGGWSVAK